MELANFDSFTAHVSSTPSTVFPDNRPSQFQVELGEKVQMESSDIWEVALSYVSMPIAYYRTSPVCDVIAPPRDEVLSVQYKHVNRGKNKGSWSPLIVFHRGPYATLNHLLIELNDRLPTIDTKNGDLRDLRFVFNYEILPGKHIVQLRHKNRLPSNSESIAVKMSAALTHTLGFPPKCHSRTGFQVEGSVNVQGYKPHVGGNSFYPCERDPRQIPEMLNVSCSIVDSEFTAWGRKERILHSTTMTDMFDQRPQLLTYKRIAVTRLDQMRFEILDAEGNEMDFETVKHEELLDYISNIHIGLHFRRQTGRDQDGRNTNRSLCTAH